MRNNRFNLSIKDNDFVFPPPTNVAEMIERSAAIIARISIVDICFHLLDSSYYHTLGTAGFSLSPYNSVIDEGKRFVGSINGRHREVGRGGREKIKEFCNASGLKALGTFRDKLFSWREILRYLAHARKGRRIHF